MDDQKGGTRVFKKTSPNGQITTYLGKRDFIDHQTHVDIIDGMILLEQESLNKKVYASLNAAFRYGREDLDVLGLQFRKDLISMSVCVYAPNHDDAELCAEHKSGAASSFTDKTRPLTRLQERLKKKLGPNAYPFWFEIPPNAASSVTLQPAPGDTGKPCGVDYELTTYVGDNAQEKPKKQGCVRLAIRKLTYAAFDKTRPQPSIELSREFMMSSGLLHIEATLDKEMYYHGESISVNVHIQNNSNKTVKKIKTAIIQIADICLFTTATYTCEVAKLESSEGCPVEPGSTLSKVYTLCPLLRNNKDKRGLALDGKLKHEDSNLASSTFLNEGVLVENLGIVIQYKVKIKLCMGGALTTDPQVELPFTLTHPKPPVSPRSSQVGPPIAASEAAPLSPVVDMDLIQLDTNASGGAFDDDIVFEDFARLRLKGVDSEDKDVF